MSAQINKVITTFFYLGYLPIIPGTFASVVGLLIYIFLKNNFYLLVLIHLLIMILGFLLSGRSAKLFKHCDPPEIVIDEVNGMLISFFGLTIQHTGVSAEKMILIAGFIIFRILDCIKPFPANRLQRYGGDSSVGIMGDDIVAGIYTNIILRFVISF